MTPTKLDLPRKLAIAFALLAVPTLVLAHDGATGAKKERMDAMSETKGALTQLRTATSNTPIDRSAALESLDALKNLATRLPALFEKRHLPRVSEANPEIWDRPEQFSDEVRFFSEQVASARTQLDEAPSQVMRTVAAGCASCHDKFREKNQ